MRPWNALILRWLRLALTIAVSALTVGCPDLTIAFLATIEIRNDSGVDLFVTPLGSDERGAGFPALPRYEGKGSSYRYSSQQSRILIPAGSTLAYQYDTDDYNFRFLLLRSRRDAIKLLHADFSTQLHHLCCFGPQQRVYVIPPLKGLPVAPRGVEACEEGRRAPTDLFLALYPSS